jgi:putative oxidoreductase
MSRLLETRNDKSLAMARILLGFLVFVRGAQGLFGWFDGPGIHDLSSLFRLVSLYGPLVVLVGLLNFFGGIGLLAGFFTRVVAVSVAAETASMLVLWFIEPHLFLDWAITEGGASIEYYLLVLAVVLMLVVNGAGAFSLDRLLFRRRLGKDSRWVTASILPANGPGARHNQSRRKWIVHSDGQI